jgi:hypothetical protein
LNAQQLGFAIWVKGLSRGEVTETRSVMQAGWQSTLRLMNQQTGMRVLTAYAWAIGVSGFFLLVFAGSIGPKVFGRTLFPLGVTLPLVLAYSRGVSIALLAVGGALLAHSPFATRAQPVLDALSRSFTAMPCERRVQPMHGALHLARLSAIIPTCTAVGLLCTERDLRAGLHLLVPIVCFLLAVVLSAFAIGAGAIGIRRTRAGSPALVYVSIWLVPELLRIVEPSMPTCRSLMLGFMTMATACWGVH